MDLTPPRRGPKFGDVARGHTKGEEKMIGYQSPAARIGHKYEGWQDAAVIAKKVRADFKAAQKAGEFPADIKVSVRCHKYSGGQSVKATLSG